MALRPYKSAMITFGLVSIPVRFYTATKSEDVSFNLLHESCGSRVNRKWWCAEHEKLVEQEELIRAFQIAKGRFVTFTDEEIDTLESDDERALEITEFVNFDQIDPVFFEKAYYLGPGDGGSKTYSLLSSAMKKQGKVALARWVSGHKEHLVILRPFENGLILHRMFYADEVRDFAALDLEANEVKEKELRLAEMLIDELTEEQFDPLRYKDEYRERLMERIESKSRGEEIVVNAEPEAGSGEVVDIMEALRRSLEAAPIKRQRQIAARSARLPVTEAKKKKPAAPKTTRAKKQAS